MFVENDRFNRQIAIFGLEGQKMLQSIKVVLVGYGGLEHLSSRNSVCSVSTT